MHMIPHRRKQNMSIMIVNVSVDSPCYQPSSIPSLPVHYHHSIPACNLIRPYYTVFMVAPLPSCTPTSSANVSRIALQTTAVFPFVRISRIRPHSGPSFCGAHSLGSSTTFNAAPSYSYDSPRSQTGRYARAASRPSDSLLIMHSSCAPGTRHVSIRCPAHHAEASDEEPIYSRASHGNPGLDPRHDSMSLSILRSPSVEMELLTVPSVTPDRVPESEETGFKLSSWRQRE
ncbi:hypothetical protein B0H19DRAFT_543488 [Mycena capillaripes]|nr:hypothetical protein B0H19DRAFT_543488 [Mycena capillaripes]